MRLLRYDVTNGAGSASDLHLIEHPSGELCLTEDVAMLEQQLAEAQAEIERLKEDRDQWKKVSLVDCSEFLKKQKADAIRDFAAYISAAYGGFIYENEVDDYIAEQEQQK